MNKVKPLPQMTGAIKRVELSLVRFNADMDTLKAIMEKPAEASELNGAGWLHLTPAQREAEKRKSL
jgi:hypothetical protein